MLPDIFLIIIVALYIAVTTYDIVESLRMQRKLLAGRRKMRRVAPKVAAVDGHNQAASYRGSPDSPGPEGMSHASLRAPACEDGRGRVSDDGFMSLGSSAPGGGPSPIQLHSGGGAVVPAAAPGGGRQRFPILRPKSALRSSSRPKTSEMTMMGLTAANPSPLGRDSEPGSRPASAVDSGRPRLQVQIVLDGDEAEGSGVPGTRVPPGPVAEGTELGRDAGNGDSSDGDASDFDQDDLTAEVAEVARMRKLAVRERMRKSENGAAPDVDIAELRKEMENHDDAV